MVRVIKALPKNIADKIAAGEVIERPLSVVKELLENAIDADSTSITVEISKGGKELIRITDNGCGIDKDQMVLAFKRYATSKISTEEDLDNINTLGFRGEALASIAAVSKIELISKTAESKSGHKVVLDEGNVIEECECACEDGTTMIVKDIFFNLPARHKFLKNDNTESSLIIDFISKMALAYPNIKIRLISNGTILFATNGKGDIYQTILTVYSAQTAKTLIPVNANLADMSINGYISSPIESKTSRKWQIFFVNGRLIKSKLLDEAVFVAYKDKMFEGRYPTVFLFLTVNPSKIDVNIHPSKAEIKFFDENEILEFVVKSLRKALLNPAALEKHVNIPSKSSTTYVAPVNADDNAAKEFTEVSKEKEEVVVNNEKTFADNFFESLRQFDEPKKEESFEYKNEEVPVVEVQETIVTEVIEDNKFKFSKLTYIGQAFSTYLLCKDKDSVYILDQHAAHERVMFENLLAKFNGQSPVSQPMLTPIVINLSRAQKQASLDSLDKLTQIGFEIEEFGPESFIVKAIPACMKSDEAEDFVTAYVDSTKEYTTNSQIKLSEIISNSCKAAVKAHDHLSNAEVAALFEALDQCENPFSCPHGRPTFVKFTNYEIERMFKRK